MAVTREDAIRAIRQSSEEARSLSIDMDARYLRLIAMVEALPANQSGADKTWVWQLSRASDRHLAEAIRLR